MAVERRRTRRGQARRDDLVQAASRLFAEHGIANTRVRDVVSAAGISNSLFYWYFADMDDLVQATIVDARRSLRHLIAASIEGLDDPLERIYVSTRVLVQVACEHEIHRVMTTADAEGLLSEPHITEVRKSFDAFISDAVGLLAEGQARGRVRTDDTPMHMAYSWRGVVNYNVVAHHRGYLHGTVDALARSIASFVLRGVCADPAVADEVQQRHADVRGKSVRAPLTV